MKQGLVYWVKASDEIYCGLSTGKESLLAL